MSYAVKPVALWVVPVAAFGGVARHVLDVATQGLPTYRMVILCPEGVLAQRLREHGVAVTTGDLGPSAGVTSSVRAVRRAIETLRPAIVHSHLSHADVVCALAVVGTGVAHVTTEHGIAADDDIYQSSQLRARAISLVHTARLRRVDAAIAVSESTADVMRLKWGGDSRIRVIRNGVDRLEPAIERSPAPTGIHIVSLSRLSQEKGLGDLVAAVDIVRRTDPGVRLTLAGEGEERSRLLEDVRSRGLVDHVSMPGHVEPQELLNSGDVLVQLSRWENASYSILDAVVHGLGVVATPVGGNPEILPGSSLADGADHAAVADRILDQASDLTQRPTLPASWPSVGQMCDEIAQRYAGVGR